MSHSNSNASSMSLDDSEYKSSSGSVAASGKHRNGSSQEDICHICQEWGKIPEYYCHSCFHGYHDRCIIRHINQFNKSLPSNQQIPMGLMETWSNCSDLGFKCADLNKDNAIFFEFTEQCIRQSKINSNDCSKNEQHSDIVDKYMSLTWKDANLSKKEYCSKNETKFNYQINRRYYNGFKFFNKKYYIDDAIEICFENENASQICKIIQIFKDNDTRIAWVKLQRYLAAKEISVSSHRSQRHRDNCNDNSNDNSNENSNDNDELSNNNLERFELYLDTNWTNECPIYAIQNKVSIYDSIKSLKHKFNKYNNSDNSRKMFYCEYGYNTNTNKKFALNRKQSKKHGTRSNPKREFSIDSVNSNNNENNGNIENIENASIISNVKIESLDNIDSSNYHLLLENSMLRMQLRAMSDIVGNGGNMPVNYANIPLKKPQIGLNSNNSNNNDGITDFKMIDDCDERIDYGWRTEEFSRLKELLNTQCINLNKEKMKNENEYLVELNSECDDFDKWHCSDLINNFLKQNGEANDLPHCFINNEWICINDVLTKYKILKCNRVPQLVGEFGVKANIDIPKHTILCQYVGLELSPIENNKYIAGTSDECEHNSYAFQIQFEDKYFENHENDKISYEIKSLQEKLFLLEEFSSNDECKNKTNGKKGRTKTSGTPQSCHKYRNATMRNSNNNNENNNSNNSNNSNNNNESNEKEIEIIRFDRTLIIDVVALGWGNGIHASKNIISFVNDCRKNIISEQLTADDKHTQNTEFVAGCVNGWPSAFLVTSKNIKKGNDLWCYYGELYHNAMMERHSWLNKNRATRNWVAKTILKQDLNVIDSSKESYIIE